MSKQVMRHRSNYTCYFVLQSFCSASVIIIHFSLQVPPQINFTTTKIGRSKRTQSFADYSVIQNFAYSVHGIVSIVCCSIILPETVLEVGQDEVGWHPVSFRKAPKPIPLPYNSLKIISPLFTQF
jgi:hypothetical protein